MNPPQTVIISLTLDELKKLIVSSVEEALQTMAPPLQSQESTSQESFLSASQLSEKLGVSPSSIVNYRKKGIINSYQLEGRHLFKFSEVIESLQKT